MSKEMKVYTGKLKYQNKDFSFVFDNNELRLIPFNESGDESNLNRLINSLASFNIYSENERMQEPYLIGTCNETGHKMIFITKLYAGIGSYNSVLTIEILAYIDCRYERDMIDRISFKSPEINCIYSVKKAYSYTFESETFANSGIVSLTTKDFEETTTQAQTFIVNDIDVSVKFSVSRNISYNVGEPPLSLNSTMIFDFSPTNDYVFIYKLWKIAKQFVQFLCYRKNVFIPVADLVTPAEDGLHDSFAKLYVINETGDNELEILKKKRYIKWEYISGSEGKILTDIANNTLYNRHIPESYGSGKRIDAARFIMITAAFEWEFRRLYPDGVKKSIETIKMEKQADEAIQSLVDNSSGKLKKKFKFLKKFIKSDSLQTEILKMSEDFDEVIGGFGKNLYKMNNEMLNYSEMGERLANQRNAFAHGDLDKDFIGLSLLDLIYLKYVIYAIQLRYYGVDDTNIQKSINQLFGLYFAI